MKKRLQGLIAGVCIGATIAGSGVVAKTIDEVTRIYYKNIKLVIDGEEVIPKDVNGNVVEPFIMNGTTYLPVRAIGEVFDKEVEWDGKNATVYVGGIVKPAKEVYLYDKPYMECGISSEFMAGKRGTERENEHITNYVGFGLDSNEKIEVGKYKFTNHVTYPLNGAAKKIKGTLTAPAAYNFSFDYTAEYQIKCYDENGSILYQSPIMNVSTSPIDFEFDPGEALSVKIEFTGMGEKDYLGFACLIQDLAILTTDY